MITLFEDWKDDKEKVDKNTDLFFELEKKRIEMENTFNRYNKIALSVPFISIGIGVLLAMMIPRIQRLLLPVMWIFLLIIIIQSIIRLIQRPVLIEMNDEDFIEQMEKRERLHRRQLSISLFTLSIGFIQLGMSIAVLLNIAK